MLGLRDRKIDKRKLLRYAAIALTVAQTTADVNKAQDVVQQITPALMSLITVAVIIAVPILVFKVLAKSILDIIRG